MYRKLVSLANWLLPLNVQRALYRLIQLVYVSVGGHAVLKGNRVCKSRHAGDRCFVIGNGSSINEMDLLKLKYEFTLTLNKFYLHKDFKQLQPNVHIVSQPFRDLAALPCSHAYHVDVFFKEMETYYKDLDTRLFFRLDNKDYIEKNRLFRNHQVHYLQWAGNLLRSRISADIARPNTFMDASVYTAIAVAMYQGFKEIYLIGCDYDHIVEKKTVHFYGGKETYCLDGKSYKELSLNMHTYLSKMEKIQSYADKRGVKIYNAGIGGFTDTFERVAYDTIRFKKNLQGA